MRFKGAVGRYRKPSGAGVLPAAIVLPTLTLTGALSFSTSSVSGTLVANIGNVPAGVTPTLTPNDGRLVIAGSAGAWTVVTGLSASTAGTFVLTILAVGANPVAGTITVTAGATAAQITSSSTQTQPGATQRYYQATADRSGTWAISTGATMEAATGIWSLDSGNTGDGTVQITRTPTITFTPTDGTGAVTQPVTVTLTVVAAPSSVSESFTSDFTGINGAKLSTRPGWAVFGPTPMDAEPLLDGAGNLKANDVYDANGGVSAVEYSPVGALPNSETRYRIRMSASSQSNFALYLLSNGPANGLYVNLQFDMNAANMQNGIYFRQAGAQGSNVSPFGTSFVNKRADNTIDLAAKISSDGNTCTLMLVGDSTITGNIDLTGKTVGSKFGFSGDGPFGPPLRGTGLVEAVSFVKAATQLSVSDAPLYSATNEATYSFAWSGAKPVRLQHQLYDEDTGLVATGWMTGESTVSGTTSGTISYIASAPRAGNFRARFRPLNDIAVVAIAGTPTTFVANVIPFQQGYNVRSANYFQPIPMLANAGVYGEVSAGQIALPTDGMDGFANVVSTPGTNFGAFTNGIDQIISQNTAAGTLRVRFFDGPSIINRVITFTGTTPTKFEITRDGIGLIAPEWLAGMEGAEVIRDLDMVLQNFVPENRNVIKTRNTAADGFYRNDVGTGPNAPYQDIVRGMAAYADYFPGFKSYWSVIGVDLTDAEITAKATFERDVLPSRINILLQFGNEIHWNTDFPGVRRAALDGVRNGYYGAATFAAPQPQINVSYEGGGPAGTGTTNACAAGDYISFNVFNVGERIYRALQNAPAGTVVGENSFFTMDTSKDQTIASRRWEAVRLNQIIEIYRTVFGASRFASQIKPVVMGQAGGTLYGQLAAARDYVPGFFAKVWGVGTAFYFYPQDGFDGNSATAATLEASFRANMPILKAAAKQTVIDALRMGKVPCFYEGFDHNDGTYGRVGRETYTAAWDGRQTTDITRQFLSDVGFFMKTTVPGIICGYDLAAGGVWSIKKGWRDTTNKRRIGWLEGLARTS